MNKTEWGPEIWKGFHYTALGYPENPTSIDKQHYLKYYESFMFVLPCQECRQHYREHVKKMPLAEHLGNRKSLFNWTVEMHNRVNRSLGKSEMSCKEAWTVYHNNQSNVYLLLIAVVVVLVLYRNNIFTYYK